METDTQRRFREAAEVATQSAARAVRQALAELNSYEGVLHTGAYPVTAGTRAAILSVQSAKAALEAASIALSEDRR